MLLIVLINEWSDVLPLGVFIFTHSQGIGGILCMQSLTVVGIVARELYEAVLLDLCALLCSWGC